MKINIFFLCLFFIITIPGAYYLYIERVSYSAGALISASFICLLYFLKYKYIRSNKSYSIYFIILILIFVFSLYSMILFEWFQFERFFLSYLVFLICIMAAFLFVKFSLKVNDAKVYHYVSIIFYLVLFDGIIYSIKKFIFLNKAPFLIFFPEMSHFSLMLLPLLLFKLFTSKKNIYNYMLISISLLLALSCESLTLLTGTILVMLICCKLALPIFSCLLGNLTGLPCAAICAFTY